MAPTVQGTTESKNRTRAFLSLLLLLALYWALSCAVVWLAYDMGPLIRGGHYRLQQALELVGEMALIISILTSVVWFLVDWRKAKRRGWRVGSNITWKTWVIETVIVKGRVEHAIAKNDYRVRVELVYPKHKRGESGEVTVEGTNFHIPVEFVTAQSSLFTNLPKRCGRKPQAVVITLLNGDQKSDEVSLDFARDFAMADASAYTLRSELVLNGGSQ